MLVMSGPPLSNRSRFVLRTAAELAIDFGFEEVKLEHVMLALASDNFANQLTGGVYWELESTARDDELLGGSIEWSPAVFPAAGLIYDDLVKFYGWSVPSPQEVGFRRMRNSDVNKMPLSRQLQRVITTATAAAVGTRIPLVGLAHFIFAAVGAAHESGLLPESVKTGLILGQTRTFLQQYAESRMAAAQPVTTSGMQVAPGAQPHGSRKQSVVAELCVDLTEMAANGELDPVVGREVEIQRLLAILLRRSKHNAALLGLPGVGKTALVEGLAQLVVSEKVPPALAKARVLSLDVSALEAGTRNRGDLEERVRALVEELSASEHPVVLFIDEMHTLMASGRGYEASIPTVEILKPVLSRPGNLRVVGATTLDEWRRVERDAAFTRRFQTVTLDPLSVEDTVEVLARLAPSYEEHHQVSLPREVLRFAAETADRYLTQRPLPDPAIALIDGAAARRQFSNFTPGAVVTLEDVAAEASEMAQVPIAAPSQPEASRLLALEAYLSERVVGQSAATSTVARAVRRRAAGLHYGRRVAGAFLFVGPSGVGKTETAKALAEFLFSDPDAVITIDMSEYMEDHAVSRLIGAPPGYVGHSEGGQLTKALSRKPYSVVLFDEVEKASPRVLNILLQMLEEGRLTDGAGKTVDCSQSFVIATSNAGAVSAQRTPMGFVTDHTTETAYRDAISATFAPELRNRFDEIVVFNQLSADHLTEIVGLELAKIEKLISPSTISISPQAADVVVAEAQRGSGPRDIRRILDRVVKDELASMILELGRTPSQLRLEAVDGQLLLVNEDVAFSDATRVWPVSAPAVDAPSRTTTLS